VWRLRASTGATFAGGLCCADWRIRCSKEDRRKTPHSLLGFSISLGHLHPINYSHRTEWALLYFLAPSLERPSYTTHVFVVCRLSCDHRSAPERPEATRGRRFRRCCSALPCVFAPLESTTRTHSGSAPCYFSSAAHISHNMY
jgi:hypothetical protein